MPTIKPQRPHQGSHEDLLRRLRASCQDREVLEEIEQQLQAAGDEEIAGRLLRTNKGALMARLTPTRWPIAMYREDWEILIKLVESGAVRNALDTMDILDSNPEKSPRQLKQERAVEKSVQAERSQLEEAA